VPLVILGIDPGLANTGWAIVECEGDRYRSRSFGCITTASGQPIPARLKCIHDGLVELIERERPDECAVENVYFSKNVQTAFATGQARGVAILATADAAIPVEEYGPSEIKQAVTGYGAADKSQVTYMIRTILRLREDPKPDHAADALAIAVCHANGRGVRKAAARARAGERR
jgi:crossover junction endodeoxyribonuclease RuvC